MTTTTPTTTSTWASNKRRLTKAFNELRKAKNGRFVAKHNWTCCITCGWQGLPDEDEAPNAVFYHAQDTERAKRSGGDLLLAWRGDSAKIIQALNQHGLHVGEWSGDEDTRIPIILQ